MEDIKNRRTKYCGDLFKGHGGDMMIKELEEITPLPSNDDPSDILYSEIQEEKQKSRVRQNHSGNIASWR